MPADLKGKGRGSRDRELELRRAKGEASCAECRRLKLKCDRKNPCTSCIRRGCQTICPNGSLSAGQGTRFVLANTDKLHAKLLEMSQRIRQLEDALQISYLAYSQKRHPLLSDELLKIKSGILYTDNADTKTSPDALDTGSKFNDKDVSAISSEFGTLSISEKGDTCFVGRSSTEALLMVINESATSQPCNGDVPGQIRSLSEGFPFTPVNLPKSDIRRLIEARLPSYARATTLIEAYLGNLAWFTCLVDREQIMEELMPTIYKNRRMGNPSLATGNSYNRYPEVLSSEDDESYEGEYAARLPLLLAVFALGAAGDLTQPIGSSDGELYHNMAKAALALRPVFSGASMETVQTVMMIATYDFCAARALTLEPAWKMMSLGLIIASSIGLHRDPARWNVEPKTVQRWRRLFWDIFFVDKWKSLESGRPAIFNLEEVDCEFPEDKEATLSNEGTIVSGFQRWKHRFTKEVLAPIAQQLCLVRAIKYSELLELDRKLRDFETHPSLLKSAKPGPNGDKMVIMRRYNWGVLREVALLFVHRVGFARALLDTSVRPAHSPFASSLLSAYASAVTMLKIVKLYYANYPDLLLRQWIFWAHALTSAVIVGSIACRGPISVNASASLKDLEEVVELFKSAQCHPVARQGLPFLQQLLKKAELANSPIPKDVGNAREELKIIGGTTLLLNRSRKRNSSTAKSSSPLNTQNLPSGRPQVDTGSHLHSKSTSPLPSNTQTQDTNYAWPYLNRSQLPHFGVHDSIFCNTSSSVNSQSVLEDTATSLAGAPANNMNTTNVLDSLASTTSRPNLFSLDPSVDPFPSGNTNTGLETELGSTSWLEQLSSSMADQLGPSFDTSTLSVPSPTDLTLLLGDGNAYGAYTSPDVFNFINEDDPGSLTDTWNSIMGDVNIFGNNISS